MSAAPKRRLSNGSGCLLKICEDENSDDEGSIISNQEKSLYTFPKRQNNRRRSSIGGLNSKVPINPVEQARIAEMYKTVIQMSSENKLTEKNSWNYDLIDHMGKLIKDENRSVNFQKASCTLDASVKIYSNRVDDTYTSSHRILESLSRNGTINHNNGEDDEAKDEDGGNNPSKGSKRKLGSKTSRLQLAQTIENNVNALNAVKLENDITVDPMFHKISKAFDEGGAKGMLMNNLRITSSTSSLSFYFPDTEIPSSVTEITNDDDNAAADLTNNTTTSSNSTINNIDLSDLLRRADIPLFELSTITICPALDMYREQICITCESSVMEMIANICPSSSGAISSTTDNTHLSYDSMCINPVVEQQVNDRDIIDDYDGNDQFDDDDNYSNKHYDYENNQISSSSANKSFELQAAYRVQEGEVHVPTKLRWADMDILSSSNNVTQDKHHYLAADLEILTEGMDKISLSGPSEYSYFDTNAIFACNNAWAGAKHWKYATRSSNKKTSEVSTTTATAVQDTAAITVQDSVRSIKATKARVTAEIINYDTTILCDDSMFDYINSSKNDPTLQSSLTLTKLESKDATSLLLLPPDAKVQVKDLCRLFLAPNVIIPANSQQLATLLTITARQQRSVSSKIDKFLGCQSGGSERVWGVKAPDTISILTTNNDNNTTTRGTSGSVGGSYTSKDTTMAHQYHDEDDYYDDNDDGNNNNESLFGLNINQNQLVQADRKVEKIEIGYAKVSKRVNIQRLKTDIWSNLKENLKYKEILNEHDDDDDDDENTSPNNKQPSNIDPSLVSNMKNNNQLSLQPSSQSLSFQNLIYEISSETNESKQKDATLPFYFICLLHLANEHNLKIDDCAEMNELKISIDVK